MMRDPTALPAQLIEEAAYWFIAMRDETVGAENRAAFAEWLHASPQHVRAYLETAALWGEAAHLPPEPALAIVGTDDLGNVVPFRPRTTPVVDTDPLTERMASLRLRLAMVVGLCALLVAGGLFFARGEVLSTGVGEQRLVTLEDGSIVRLNARSKVVVRMSAKRRDLELIEGQALFDVAKDPRRPFVVHTDGMAVSALGTSFDVNRRRNGTVLTVLDGRVRLDARPDKGAAARAASGGIAVAAGEQATVDKSGAVDMGVAANVSAATSWIHNLLVFEDAPLETVVEELNRYSRRQIVLDDAALASLRINAVLQPSNPDALLRYLQRDQGVRISFGQSTIKIASFPVPTSSSATLLPSEH
jgi:transmembrane sensor